MADDSGGSGRPLSCLGTVHFYRGYCKNLLSHWKMLQAFSFGSCQERSENFRYFSFRSLVLVICKNILLHNHSLDDIPTRVMNALFCLCEIWRLNFDRCGLMIVFLFVAIYTSQSSGDIVSF